VARCLFAAIRRAAVMPAAAPIYGGAVRRSGLRGTAFRGGRSRV